ncbi:galactose mutarotase-like domain-containing protein [Cokeromyces recurvatus]|uniref:galactose mutarotase-like domain-containing protein n=1 Tax=Cokeromyces recurvatus TaxID=90255 RepID=UPI00221F3526|nr:galactose mutarotase-like domain-containing protein [Cokeromyces recurvatus]KAI7899406.1 galactose mutarotase-like domain-containing protein [Cokeromyces recurvatus]
MKMYSSRTVNSECVNSQNPFGFHLSDGAIYNYLTGDEYMDTFGAWNWELIPGITVDMFGTPLSCNRVKRKGKKEFVGGATDDNIGIAVMDYMNPIHGNLAFKKTAFFFPSGYAIQVGLTHSRNKTAPLVTVLDQRRRNGNIYISGRLRNTNSMYESKATSSIWHDNMGYYFPNAETIYVNSKPRAADWASIGISRGNEMHQLWTSYIKHSNTLTNNRLLTQYVVQPGISLDEFNEKIHNNKGSNKIPIQLDFKESSSYIHAAYSAADKTIAIAFWAPGNYSSSWWGKSLIIESTKPCVLLFRKLGSNKYRITIADPSQTLLDLNLSFTMAGGTRLIKIKFPTGNNAGKGVVVETIMCF